MSLVSRPSVTHGKHHCLSFCSSLQGIFQLILARSSSLQLVVAHRRSWQVIVGHCRSLQVLPCFSNYNTRPLIFFFCIFLNSSFQFITGITRSVIVAHCRSLQIIVDHCRSLQVIPCFSNYVVSIHDLDLFSLNVNSITDTDYNALFGTICCKYYSPSTLTQLISSKEAHQSSLSFFHTNIRSLRGNLENFQSYFE